MKKKWPANRTEAAIYFAGNGDKILDIGCGNGTLLANLYNNFNSLYGIDIYDHRKSEIKEKYNDKIKFFLCSNDIKTNFPDEFFDVIITSDVIEHIFDIFTAFSEISRLVKKGGKIITITPNIAYLKRRLTLLFGKFPSTSAKNEGFNLQDNTNLYDGGHLHYFTFSSLEKLYKKYGITNIKKYGFGKLGIIHNIYPSLLSPACCIVGIK